MATKVNFTVNDVHGGTAGNGAKFSEPNVAAMIKALHGENYIVSGFTVPTSDPDLVIPVAAGEAIISGYRVVIDTSTNVTCTANATNHVFLKLTKDGLGNVTGAAFEVNTTGTAPADSAKICTAVTDADNVTSTTDARPKKSGPISSMGFYYHNPNPSDNLTRIQSDTDDAQWLTVGPTGSGANVIWNALDAIPFSARGIKVFIELQASHGAAAAGEHRIYCFLNKTGDTLTSSTAAYVAAWLPDMINVSVNWADVPIDDGKKFLFKWIKSVITGGSLFLDMRLLGWYI